MPLQFRPGFAANTLAVVPATHAAKLGIHSADGASGAGPAVDIARPPLPAASVIALREPIAHAATRIPLTTCTDARHDPHSVIDCLRELAEHRPGDTAFTHRIDDAASWPVLTYAQLDRRARAIGRHLQAMGLAGHNVVLAYAPGLDFITGFFGALYAGCVAVPAYPPRKRTLERFHALALDAGATAVLSTRATIGSLRGIAATSTALLWNATDDIPDSGADDWTPHDPALSSLALIQYTSGSTSQPKGVMLSHGNLVANAQAISAAFDIGPESKAVFWLPTFHDMGLIGGILMPIYCGIPNTILAPAMFVQKPFLWLDTISRSGASVSGGPNFAYDLCVRRITAAQRASLDLSAWSVAFVGAETVDPATLARFAETFAPCGFRPASFYPCYGLAEATLMVTGPGAGDGATIRTFDDEALTRNVVQPMPDDASGGRTLAGCGAPVGSLRVAIVETGSGERAAPDRVGEIWVAGDSVGNGYWRNPVKSATTFDAHIGKNGSVAYLRTGDLGFMHDQQLYITGRMDDLIIVRGRNHHPQDIEATARRSHPLLAAGHGAAFGWKERGVQRLGLVHEVNRDGSADLSMVIAAVRAAVHEEHGVALDAVVLIRTGTIAKTSSGKVQRRTVCAAFKAGELSPLARHDAPTRVASLDEAVTPTGAIQCTAFAAVCQHALALSGTGLAEMSPDTPLETLGLDSLQRVELVAALDQSFGQHLPDSVYTHASTLGDLAAAVQKHLIAHPHTVSPARAVPGEHYNVAQFPEYLELKRHKRMLLAVTETNPYFRVDQGDLSPAPDAPGQSHIDGEVLINYCAYDYIGMAHDPAVIAATKGAIDRYGTGAGASRLVSGEKQVHRDLEDALAAFIGTPAALVLVSGHATNVTTIGHLMGPGDLIVHDVLAHNSILQGARLSGATCRGFAHNDWRALDVLLSGIRHSYRRVLIAIEGVYSMDGDFPDLARFIGIKERHQALLYVDEAHSLGTMGATGRGLAEHAAVDPCGVDVWMGTLSKSLASCGGYIAGSAELVEFLKYTAPGFVYSVGISPPNAAAALAALTVLEREPQRVTRLHSLSSLFLGLARERGLDTGGAGGTPIIPIIVGNSVRCLLLARALVQRGINVQPIIHPAVPEHATRLRVFITINHTEALVRSAVDAIAEELAKL